MTTTIMRNSKIGDAWIAQAQRDIPISFVIDASGQPTRNILTGPVRLCFPDLFQPAKAQKRDDGSEGMGKFGTQILFPPGADFSVLHAEYFRILAEQFADYRDGATGNYYGLYSPFRDQAEKCAKFPGYTPGCVFITCTSRYKPPVVDRNMNPVVDANKVYPGVWAVLSINAYAFGKSPPQPKKGVAFGIQSVMILADDEKLGGGAADPKTQFKGVAVAPPAGAPAAMFGQPQPTPGAPAAPFMTPHPSAAPPAPAEEDLSWMQ